jgi:hypothetical protein
MKAPTSTSENPADFHSPGFKDDSGKNRLGLVIGGFSEALEAVGVVGTYGAAKYTDGGWETVPGGRDRYTDAMLRHLLARMQGELRDGESGLDHLAHVAWNALAVLELTIRQGKYP